MTLTTERKKNARDILLDPAFKFNIIADAKGLPEKVFLMAEGKTPVLVELDELEKLLFDITQSNPLKDVEKLFLTQVLNDTSTTIKRLGDKVLVNTKDDELILNVSDLSEALKEESTKKGANQESLSYLGMVLNEIDEKIKKDPAIVNGVKLNLDSLLEKVREAKPLDKEKRDEVVKLLQKEETKMFPVDGMIQLSDGGKEIGLYTTCQAEGIIPLLPNVCKDGRTKEHPRATALKSVVMCIRNQKSLTINV